MGEACLSWYTDCQPALLSNRVLRSFLLQFSQKVWPEVVKLSAIYGVLSLQQTSSAPHLSVEDIKLAIEQVSTRAAVGASVPGLKAQVDELSAKLAEIGGSLPGSHPLQEQKGRPGEKRYPTVWRMMM